MALTVDTIESVLKARVGDYIRDMDKATEAFNRFTRANNDDSASAAKAEATSTRKARAKKKEASDTEAANDKISKSDKTAADKAVLAADRKIEADRRAGVRIRAMVAQSIASRNEEATAAERAANRIASAGSKATVARQNQFLSGTSLSGSQQIPPSANALKFVPGSRSEADALRDQSTYLQLINKYKRQGLNDTDAQARAEKALSTIVRTRARDEETALRRRMELNLRRNAPGIGASFRALAGTAVAGIGIAEVSALNDKYIEFTNRLRIAGVEGAAQKQVQDALFASAQKYGVEIDALARIFGKATQAGKQYGATQQQNLQFTNTIAAAVKVQGGSVEQARGALLQLGQALQTGTVRAEEFNSIQEGLFPLLQAAAAASDKYGGSVAKLRQEVLNGTLTSEDFYRLILKGSKALEEQAAKATLTTAAGFTTLTNAMVIYFGESDKVAGVSAALGAVFKGVADNLDILIPAIAIVATGLGVGFVTNAVKAAYANAVLSASAAEAVVSVGGLAVAEGAAAATGAGLVIADEAVAFSLGGVVIAARAAGISLLTAFGGPIAIAVTTVATALVYLALTTNQAKFDTAAFAKEGELLAIHLQDVNRYANSAASGIASVGSQARSSAGAVREFAGAVGDAANKLYELAKARRRELFVALQNDEVRARQQKEEAQGRLSSANASLEGTSGKLGPLPGVLETINEATNAFNVASAREKAAQEAAFRLEKVPLSNLVSGSERENGRDIAGEAVRVARDLRIAREAGVRSTIDSLESQQFEINQYKKYRKQGLSPQAAQEASNKDKSDFQSASQTAQGNRDEKTNAAAQRRAAARAKAAEKDAAGDAARYASMERRANNDIAAAREELVSSAEERARIEKLRIEDDRQNRNDELNQQFKQGQLGVGGKGKARLLELTSLNDQRAELESKIVDLKERERQREDAKSLADAQFSTERDTLQIAIDTAETRKEERDARLALLELTRRHQIAEYDGVLASEAASKAEKDGAILLKNAYLKEGGAAARNAINKDTESPLARYRREIAQVGNNINDSLEQIEVNGLQSLNDGITEAITGAKSLGDVFKQVANQIIADLIRIAVQQAINKALGGSNSGDGGQGGILGFVTSLIGGGGGGNGSGEEISKALGLFKSIGGRATGGPVSAGSIYRVNEYGTEYFKPNVGGQVLPMGEMRGRNNNSTTIVQPIINVDARGAVMNDKFAADILSRANNTSAVYAAQGARLSIKSTPSAIAKARRYGA